MQTTFIKDDLRFEILSEAHLQAYWQSVERSRNEIESWLGIFFSPLNEGLTKAFIQDRNSDREQGNGYYFAVFQETTFIGLGFINTINQRHRFANLGYWVDTTQTGRGYATRIVRGLATFAFGELALYRVELVIDVNNKGSQKVAEKAGATNEGVLRNRLQLYDKPCDAVMFSLIPS